MVGAHLWGYGSGNDYDVRVAIWNNVAVLRPYALRTACAGNTVLSLLTRQVFIAATYERLCTLFYVRH